MSFEVFLGRGYQFTMTSKNRADPLGARQGELPFNETGLVPERAHIVEAVASAVIEQLSDSANVGETVQSALNSTAVVEAVASTSLEQVSDPVSLEEIVQNSLSNVTSAISSLTNSTSTAFSNIEQVSEPASAGETLQNALSNVTSAISSLTNSTSTALSNLTKNFNFTQPATRALNASEVSSPAGTVVFLPSYSVTNTTLENCTALVKRVTQAEPGKNILFFALGTLVFLGASYCLYKRISSSITKPPADDDKPAVQLVPQKRKQEPLVILVKEIPQELLDKAYGL